MIFLVKGRVQSGHSCIKIGLCPQMVPPAVAEQLKSGHQVEPQYFSSATMCYIDVVDFMIMSARIQAQHAAAVLGELLRYSFQEQVL